MNLRMKRVLYALIIGIVFVLFTKITDAETPRVKVTNASHRTTATTTTNQQIGALFSYQQSTQPQSAYLKGLKGIQPQFIATPATPTAPNVATTTVTAKQFVPLFGSGYGGSGQFGSGSDPIGSSFGMPVYGSGQQQPLRVDRFKIFRP